MRRTLVAAFWAVFLGLSLGMSAGMSAKADQLSGPLAYAFRTSSAVGSSERTYMSSGTFLGLELSKDPSEDMAMIGLIIAERRDDPCEFQIIYDDVRDDKSNAVVDPAFLECGKWRDTKFGTDRSRSTMKLNPD